MGATNSMLKEGAVLKESWEKDGILYELYTNPDGSVTTIDKPLPDSFKSKGLIKKEDNIEGELLELSPSNEEVVEVFSEALGMIIQQLIEIKEIMKLIKNKL